MSMKVLIADPDWRFVRQASQYLETHAHLVVCEPRAREAQAHADHWRPDLVILAVESAEKVLGSLYSLQPRPAVLLTGRMDRYDLAWKAWQKGGDELLMKPIFKAEELHDAIVTALENVVTGARGRRAAASA